MAPKKIFGLGVLSGAQIGLGAALMLAVGGASPMLAANNPGLHKFVTARDVNLLELRVVLKAFLVQARSNAATELRCVSANGLLSLANRSSPRSRCDVGLRDGQAVCEVSAVLAVGRP